MRIQISNAGKRFNRDWIFRHADINFLPQQSYAITGSNGSGKSTLLQVLAGSMDISEGTVAWYVNEAPVSNENVYAWLTIAAPYLEVIEELTATEFLQFHLQFKSLQTGLTPKDILELVELDKAANKQIRYYSSGMKQRLKLAQAIFTNTPLLLLDEPCTNLDTTGFRLYNSLIANYARHKTIIVSSNDENEYSFCQHVVAIKDYK